MIWTVSEAEKKSSGEVSEAAASRLSDAKARLSAARSGSASCRKVHELLVASGVDVSIAHHFLAKGVNIAQLRELTDFSFLGEIPELEVERLQGAIASLRL